MILSGAKMLKYPKAFLEIIEIRVSVDSLPVLRKRKNLAQSQVGIFPPVGRYFTLSFH